MRGKRESEGELGDFATTFIVENRPPQAKIKARRRIRS